MVMRGRTTLPPSPLIDGATSRDSDGPVPTPSRYLLSLTPRRINLFSEDCDTLEKENETDSDIFFSSPGDNDIKTN